MEVSSIIKEIDAQIAKLQQARALLVGSSPKRIGPGRPKGSKKTSPATATARKRKLSAAGRRRISEAMKKRWADRRKQAAKG